MSMERKPKRTTFKPTVVKPKATVTVKPKPVAEAKPSKLAQWLSEAPIATTGVPTTRWYGEQFLPSYQAWIQKGKKLIV